MDKIPYFDAHCDTISRCVETGEDFTGEDREFYAVPCSLRRSEGHIDLERTERAFSRYAQFFAFYRDGRGLRQRQLRAPARALSARAGGEQRPHPSLPHGRRD